ncbi:phosphoglycolate phosphatase [Winogradskyella eximia]|uniref:phosphoglycolate phosphatase n=1 Tax=Winogradskyella eximia TaxID=262006 RepID=A0A3D9H4H9_9FLAO|nr:HAD family hydrolase [Winogradskyella eximia]RED44091.1 phosphoglycolate phosphatase [Winogradskyella eximia]
MGKKDKNIKFKAVIFDLDGTLVNSLQDIADAMNTVLKSYNYPTHSYEKHQSFIGSGIRSLVSKSLPLAHNDEQQVERCLHAMIEVYRDNCTNKTTPYDGIIELLDNLVSRDIKLSVLSNKADELTKKITHALFPNYFDPVIGLTSELLKKPNPFTVIEIAKNLGIKAEEIIYVGDTGIDMQTATNANMYAVGVLWGYRPKEELVANGAQYILSHPLDIMKLI